jgi:hypothetical protein
MLKSHFDAVENALLARSKIVAQAGHTLHKGTPREAFVSEFLKTHLSERLAIGSGEIIDANSRPGQPRNQIDLLLYRHEYPKLEFGGGINAYLAESVVVTIEVKSVLTKEELRHAIQTARILKGLQRNITPVIVSGYQPPSILTYVVAYDGPATMRTVHSWISEIYQSLGIVYPQMGTTPPERLGVASPALDAVFVLGKGAIYFENVPTGLVIPDEVRAKAQNTKWVMLDMQNGSLLLLFVFLTMAASGLSWQLLNPIPYLASFTVPADKIFLGV